MSEDLSEMLNKVTSFSGPEVSNREFILLFTDEYEANWITHERATAKWVAGIGNPSQHLGLGESSPEIFAGGATAFEAVKNLADKLDAMSIGQAAIPASR
jgi:hypothetical protein